MGKAKHAKKKQVVKVMLAHQGLDLVVIDDVWYLVCQCDARALLGDRDEAARSEWHAGHIVNVLKGKGWLK